MARGIDSSKSSTLKQIANKQYTEDIPRMIDIDKLVEHEDNEYLFGMQGIHHMVQGIQQNGFKGAIEVWDLKDGTFKIYSGHRRFRAVKELGYNQIKCFVYPLPDSEPKKRRELLGANLYGRNSINSEDPIHTARQIEYHLKTLEMESFEGSTREELAKEFGTSSSQIYKYMSLLNLNTDLQEAVANKEIPFGQASSMAVLDGEKQTVVKNAIDKLRQEEGADNVTRNDVQKVIDYVKKEEDEKTDSAEKVVTALSETKEFVHREQVEVEEAEPMDGQIIINDNVPQIIDEEESEDTVVEVFKETEVNEDEIEETESFHQESYTWEDVDKSEDVENPFIELDSFTKLTTEIETIMKQYEADNFQSINIDEYKKTIQRLKSSITHAQMAICDVETEDENGKLQN